MGPGIPALLFFACYVKADQAGYSSAVGACKAKVPQVNAALLTLMQSIYS